MSNGMAHVLQSTFYITKQLFLGVKPATNCCVAHYRGVNQQISCKPPFFQGGGICQIRKFCSNEVVIKSCQIPSTKKAQNLGLVVAFQHAITMFNPRSSRPIYKYLPRKVQTSALSSSQTDQPMRKYLVIWTATPFGLLSTLSNYLALLPANGRQLLPLERDSPD